MQAQLLFIILHNVSCTFPELTKDRKVILILVLELDMCSAKYGYNDTKYSVLQRSCNITSNSAMRMRS